MTTAKITRQEGYKCAPRGAVVETIPFGKVVTGRVAEWALADGAAQRMFDPREEVKPDGPTETKKERPASPTKKRIRRKASK